MCSSSACEREKLLPVFVNQGVESHPVSPAGGEVVDVDVGISGGRGKVSDLKVKPPWCREGRVSNVDAHPAVFI